MAIVQTKPASYKGIDFLMLVSRISGGQKDVLFEFPNSSKQTVESLGTRPRSYSMSVIIPHSNYIETRDRLLRVLEDGVKGPLDHPFYGRVENIVARTYTIVERLSDLGRAELEISFAVSDNIGVPQKAKNAISEAAAQNTALSDSIAGDIAADYDADESFFGNFQDAQELVGGMVDAFDNVHSFAGTLTDEINNYASLINTVSTEINQIVAVPQQLANTVRNLFSTVNGLFGTVDAAFDALTSLNFFGFGDNDQDILQSTQGRVQRAQNRDVVNQAVQSGALGYAYLNAAQIEFQTTDDIDSVSILLEDQYNKIQGGRGVSTAGLATPINTVRGVSQQTLTALTDLRTVVNELLDDKRAKAKTVVTINTRRMPMAVLAYRYYGNTDLTDTLLELNEIKGASFVQGDIKILTA